MHYLQRHPVDRGLLLLRSTLVIFIFTNQLLFSPYFALSHTALIQNSHTREITSLLSQKKSLLSQASQPIIFVHGINENAYNMGKSEFAPLYSALQPIAGLVKTFFYVDDRAYAGSCPPKYSPCISQSSILDNAVKLAGMISDLYQKMQHKVTLIGYSMGAAIIRTALSGCQPNVHCQAALGLNIAGMVNNVFFLDGVQQGSWMMQSKKGGIIPAEVSFLRKWVFGPLLKIWKGLDMNSMAARDLAPQSINITSHNSVLPANNIHYFNFYGDIKLRLTFPTLFSSTVTQIDIGDGVVLPGTDNPQDTPFWGGERFCLQCNGQNTSKIDANTTYRQWPLTIEKSIDLSTVCTPLSVIQHTCLLGSIFDLLANTPQLHTNIPSKASLDGTDIRVADTPGSPTTSIANEIALQLQVMPPTQTSCPAQGTARAAIMIPLALGKDQNIVYVDDEGDFQAPTFSILKRYDVATKLTTEIVKFANRRIDDAQVSADGQWVLFVSKVSGQVAIQMVRMDGQGLQTLYCTSPSPGLNAALWSPNQNFVLFEEGIYASQLSTVYLLNVTSGSIQPELIQSQSSAEDIQGYEIQAWLDNTKVYLVGITLPSFSNSPHPKNIYVLDLSKGANQQGSDLLKVTDVGAALGYQWDFDKSFDGTQLFVSQCKGCGTGGYVGGPSSITVQPALGGSARTIYSQTLPVTKVEVISNTILLFLIHNNSGDTSNNGLWIINTDGSGLRRLTSDGDLDFSSFCENSFCIKSGISRDGLMYAYQLFSLSSGTVSLLFGSLSGNTPITFVSLSQQFNTFNLVIAGWTTM